MNNSNPIDELTRGYSGNRLLLAFLGGAVAGVALALLTAPQSGRETRDTVRGWASNARDQASRIPQVLKDAGSRAGHAAREAYTDVRGRERESLGMGESRMTEGAP